MKNKHYQIILFILWLFVLSCLLALNVANAEEPTALCKRGIKAGEVVVYTATACPGSRFVEWKGCTSVKGNACTVVGIEQDQTIEAVFDLVPIPKNFRMSSLMWKNCSGPDKVKGYYLKKKQKVM